MSEHFEQLLTARRRLDLPGSGVDWIEAMRSENARRFRALGLPTVRDEDWKYTSIKPIAKRAFTPAAGDVDPAKPDLRAFDIPDLDTHRIVLVDGCYQRELSRVDGLEDGVRVCGLAEAINEDPGSVRPWLGRLAEDTEHGFRALNSAFLQDGVFIRVPGGVRVDKPIELCCVQGSESGEIVSQPRHLVVAGENSRFTLIERYVSLHGNRYLTNAITEVFAEPNAQLEHYKLQQESIQGYHIGSWLIEQREGSRVTSHNVALGGAIARTDLRVWLDGANACCGLNGVYVLTGRQHVDNHTKVDHRNPDTTSNEFYKGVLDGRSRAVFHGRIVVHPDAQHTDARQQNKNLLLSADAEVDTKPQLEIYADDVVCSHGATVGQLDADALFYLKTRGVDEPTARSLLTFAFAKEVIDKFELPQLRTYIEDELANKMFSVDHLEAML